MRGGADAFYGGEIAADIVAAVRGAADNPGVMTRGDLARYEVRERDPVCAPYRGFDVCGMGPPSSGALSVGQILGLVSAFDLGARPDSATAWQVIGDASRLAFADRGRYIADSDFAPLPLKGLLDAGYLRQRAALISEGTRLAGAEPGTPPWDHSLRYGDDRHTERSGTSHISIVDAAGNVVSMTTTIEGAFGSRLMVRGFLLNNELTDFSFTTREDARLIANRVEPGKRPRSSMAPTIVLKDGAPYMAIGSPGGSQIIGYVAKALIAHIDWGLGIADAIALPNIVNRFGAMEIEEGPDAERMAAGFRALGYETRIGDMTSGLQGIVITPEGLEGAADPRREGTAIGE